MVEMVEMGRDSGDGEFEFRVRVKVGFGAGVDEVLTRGCYSWVREEREERRFLSSNGDGDGAGLGAGVRLGGLYSAGMVWRGCGKSAGMMR